MNKICALAHLAAIRFYMCNVDGWNLSVSNKLSHDISFKHSCDVLSLLHVNVRVEALNRCLMILDLDGWWHSSFLHCCLSLKRYFSYSFNSLFLRFYLNILSFNIRRDFFFVLHLFLIYYFNYFFLIWYTFKWVWNAELCVEVAGKVTQLICWTLTCLVWWNSAWLCFWAWC